MNFYFQKILSVFEIFVNKVIRKLLHIRYTGEQGVTSTQSTSLPSCSPSSLSILVVSSLHSVILYYASKCPIANSSNNIATYYSQKYASTL